MYHEGDLADVPFWRLRFYAEELRIAGYENEALDLFALADELEIRARQIESDSIHRFVKDIRLATMRARTTVRETVQAFFPMASMRGQNGMLSFYIFREPFHHVVRALQRNDDLLLLYPFYTAQDLMRMRYFHVIEDDLLNIVEKDHVLEAYQELWDVTEREASDVLFALSSSDATNSRTTLQYLRVMVVKENDLNNLFLVSSKVHDLNLLPVRNFNELFNAYFDAFSEIAWKEVEKRFEVDAITDDFRELKIEDLVPVENYVSTLSVHKIRALIISFLIRFPLETDFERFKELYEPSLFSLAPFTTVNMSKKIGRRIQQAYKEYDGIV